MGLTPDQVVTIINREVSDKSERVRLISLALERAQLLGQVQEEDIVGVLQDWLRAGGQKRDRDAAALQGEAAAKQAATDARIAKKTADTAIARATARRKKSRGVEPRSQMSRSWGRECSSRPSLGPRTSGYEWVCTAE